MADQYKTYLEWRRIGRQVKKGEHGERNHLGETVFGFEQTSALNSEKRIRRWMSSEGPWDFMDELYGAGDYYD